jgi:hypothetical protein
LPRPGKPLKPSLKGKAPPGWAEPFFFFYPIYSEYQVQTKNRPNIFEVIVVEVVWNDGQHFGTVSKKLDKFSTFDGFAAELCLKIIYLTQGKPLAILSSLDGIVSLYVLYFQYV